MSLSENTLTDELRKVFDKEHPGFLGFGTEAEQKSKITDAYDTYATQAEDASGDSLQTANKAGFEAALVFTVPGTAVSAAASITAAFTTYWTGATFNVDVINPNPACSSVGGNLIFGAETTSVAAVGPTVGLLAGLTSALSDTAETGEEKARSIASALHSATISSVLVTIVGLDTTPPTAGPLPITNICTIS